MTNLKEEQLRELREKIIEKVPDIVTNKNAQIIHLDHSVEYFVECRPITLADVLIALGGFDYEWGINGEFLEFWYSQDNITSDVVMSWDLTKSLNEQSEETIKFLNKLIK